MLLLMRIGNRVSQIVFGGKFDLARYVVNFSERGTCWRSSEDVPAKSPHGALSRRWNRFIEWLFVSEPSHAIHPLFPPQQMLQEEPSSYPSHRALEKENGMDNRICALLYPSMHILCGRASAVQASLTGSGATSGQNLEGFAHQSNHWPQPAAATSGERK